MQSDIERLIAVYDVNHAAGPKSLLYSCLCDAKWSPFLINSISKETISPSFRSAESSDSFYLFHHFFSSVTLRYRGTTMLWTVFLNDIIGLAMAKIVTVAMPWNISMYQTNRRNSSQL